MNIGLCFCCKILNLLLFHSAKEAQKVKKKNLTECYAYHICTLTFSYIWGCLKYVKVIFAKRLGWHKVLSNGVSPFGSPCWYEPF